MSLTETNVRIVRGYGSSGELPRSFDDNYGVRAFSGWVYAAAMLNAKGAASVPLRLYVRRRLGRQVFTTRAVPVARKRFLAGHLRHVPSMSVIAKAGQYQNDYEEVSPDHPALKLLRNPRPMASGLYETQLRFLFLELLGNAYLVCQNNEVTQRPAYLHTLLSHYVHIVVDQSAPPNGIRGYVYGVRPNTISFSAEDVGHVKYANPRNLFYGLGKVEAGWDIVQQNDAAHRMDWGLYANAARPDYAVIIKGVASEAALNQAEMILRQQFRDARDAGKFVTLSGDVSIVPLAWPPKDLGPKDQILEEIVAVFGVPRDKLLGNSTFSNAEQADVGWLRDTILPMLSLNEDVLNTWYLSKWGLEEDAFFAYDDPVPANLDSMATRHVGYVNAGVLTPNEVREELGFGRLAGGDELRSPGIRPAEYSLLSHQSNHDCCEKKAATPRYAQRLAPFAGDIERLAKEVGDIFARQSAEIIAALIGEQPKAQKDSVSDDSLRRAEQVAKDARWKRELEKTLRAELTDIALRAGLNEADALNSAFSMSNPNVIRWAQEYIPRLAGTIASERAKELMKIIARSLTSEDGRQASVTELAHRLKESPAFSSDGIAGRAETIARSETARAAGRGAIESWRESGVVKEKEWIMSPGACEFCRTIAGARRKLDESYAPLGSVIVGAEGGKMQIDYDSVVSPPLHPNCTCDIVPVLSE